MTIAFEESTKLNSRCVPETKCGITTSKPLATIQSWAVVEGVVSQRFAPLQAGYRLRGYAFGSEHAPYGKLVHTSPIIRVDLNQGLVETRNTIYRLGEACEEYESWRVRSY